MFALEEVKPINVELIPRFSRFRKMVMGFVSRQTGLTQPQFYTVIKMIWPVVTGKESSICVENPVIWREIIHGMCRLFQIYSQTSIYSRTSPLRYGWACGGCGNTPGVCTCESPPVSYEFGGAALTCQRGKPVYNKHAACGMQKALKKGSEGSTTFQYKLQKPYIYGNYELMPMIVNQAALSGQESSLHREPAYMSLTLTWQGICTLFHLQEQLVASGLVPREVFAKIIGFVFC